MEHLVMNLKYYPNLGRANMKMDELEGEERTSTKSFFITLN